MGLKPHEKQLLEDYGPQYLTGWTEEDIRLQIAVGRRAQEELRKLKEAIKVVTASAGK